MGISLVGTASSSAVNGGDVTVTLPVGTTQGDVVYAAYVQIGADLDMSMVTSGYTELADLFSDDDLDTNLGVFRKVMGLPADTEAVFNGDGTAGSHVAGAVIVLRGVDATPEDAVTTTATGTNSPNANSPSITTVTNGAWVITIGGSEGFSLTAPGSPPTNYSNAVTLAAGSKSLIMMATREIAVAGAEDPGNWNPTGDTASDSWAAVTIAVRPSSLSAIYGSTQLAFSLSGTLLGSGALSGPATLPFTLAGALTSVAQIVGSTTLTFSLSGNLDQFPSDVWFNSDGLAVAFGVQEGSIRPAIMNSPNTDRPSRQFYDQPKRKYRSL